MFKILFIYLIILFHLFYNINLKKLPIKKIYNFLIKTLIDSQIP